VIGRDRERLAHLAAELDEGHALMHALRFDVVAEAEVGGVAGEFGLAPQVVADEERCFLVDADRERVLARCAVVVGVDVHHQPEFGFVLHGEVVDRDRHVGLRARRDARWQESRDRRRVGAVADLQHRPVEDVAGIALRALGGAHDASGWRCSG
jgi:hypothetical protein